MSSTCYNRGKMRNIEIKARVNELSQILERAKSLSKSNGEIIKQHDTFFNVNQGRLKLRKFENGAAELIFYDRPDLEGPQLCTYEKSEVAPEKVDSLIAVLDRALGSKQIVRKIRHLFLVEQTRIHIDCVEDLGNFMELEVCLKPEQSVEDGQKIAENLMKLLGVDKSELIPVAYADLLAKN